MARRTITPLDFTRTWMELARIGFETQAVMTMRLLGMAGIWPVAGNETARMISEKAPAFAAAWAAGAKAAARGALPHQVIDASVRPLGVRTRSNNRRLVRRAYRR